MLLNPGRQFTYCVVLTVDSRASLLGRDKDKEKQEKYNRQADVRCVEMNSADVS